MAKTDLSKLSLALGVGFLLAVFLIPPLCPVHTNPLTSFWTEWVAGVLMLASFGLVFWSKPLEFALPKAAWLWLAWGLSLLLSVLSNHYDLWQPVIFAAVFWVMGLLSLLLGVELIARLGRERTLLIVAYALVLAGLLQAVLGFARYYGLLAQLSIYLRPLQSARMEGLFNYPTLTGFSLWLSLCALLYLFVKGRLGKRWLGWVALAFGSLIMAVPIVATGDRSSIVYWLCLAFVSLLVAIRRLRQAPNDSTPSTKRIIGAMGVISFVFLVSIPLFKQFDSVMGLYMQSHGYPGRNQNVTNLYSRKGHFWGIRGSSFQKAFYLARRSPLFGIGPGNYSYQAFLLNDKIKDSLREGTIDTHTHNIFSMLLAENGVFGLLVFSVSCVLMVWWWWQLGPTLESVFIGSVLMDFFAYSNLEYPLWYLNFLVIFMVFCGFLSPCRVERLAVGFLKPLMATVLLVFGGLLAWRTAQGYVAISSVRLSHIASMADATKLEKWFASPLWAAEAGEVFEQVTVASKADIPDQLSLAQQVIEHLPTPPALIHKTMLLEFQGKQNQACQLATATANSYPSAAQSYQRILGWYESTGNTDDKGLMELQPCFKRGLESWRAQWD